MKINFHNSIINTAVLGFSLIISISLAEYILRWVKPQPTYSNLLEQVGSYYSPSEVNSWELKKNYSGNEPSMENPGKKVTISINSNGFRGEEIKSNLKNILIIGDSYTFGVYVNDNETYPFVLGKMMENKNYQVINAGFTAGLETDQQYVWLRSNIDKIKPDIVILGVFLGNDINGIKTKAWRDIDVNGLPTKWINEDFKVSESGVIKNITNFNSKSALEYIYSNKYLNESHLIVALGRVCDKIFNKNKIDYVDAYKFIYGDYDEKFLANEKIFIKLIEEMNSIITSKNAKFLVLMLPINFMVEPEKMSLFFPNTEKLKGLHSVYYNRLEKILGEKGINFLNIEKKMKEEMMGPYFPKNGEPHFNPTGHSFTAEKLHDYFVNNNNHP
jgi:lysophospholipase L1-like esterase